MGSFFGFVGMLIGAPLFSVLYTIVKEHTERRLAKRNLPTETAAYADLNPVVVFEESVGMTPDHFTETVAASLPAKTAEPEKETDEAAPEAVPEETVEERNVSETEPDEPKEESAAEVTPPDDRTEGEP